MQIVSGVVKMSLKPVASFCGLLL